ncbi:class I SAM-dependent methyltransferase [Plantibacter flavus]|uniref:class I SAM-dependent methyltransferase n=1 Tax=Plantibacter flavus TaxID=150123 RepID=UPI003F148815
MTREGSAVQDGLITAETPVAWLGKASYWTPDHLMPSAWHEHAPFAFWLIDALRPATFVELGSHNGFSYFAMCEAVRRLGLPTQCSAIDSWEGDEHAGFYGDDVFRAVTEINDAQYPDFSQLIRAYFSDAVDRFEDGSIELLHIDGRHRYEDAVEDFETYRPKLAANAVVIFHDTFEFDRGFGVHRLWAELEQRYPDSTFQFEHGHGLGVLGIGAELPQGIVDFFAAGRASGEQVREDYARLGAVVEARAVEVQARLDDTARIAAQQQEIEALRQHAARLDAELAGARARFDEVTGSTAWRATAPARRLVELVRRRR